MPPESENNAMQTEMGEFCKKITENILPRSESSRLPSLKGVDKKKLIYLLEMANDELKNMPITTLDQVNYIAYATARVISCELGFKLEHRPRNEPPWKIRKEKKNEK
jgi:hypothetical protein